MYYALAKCVAHNTRGSCGKKGLNDMISEDSLRQTVSRIANFIDAQKIILFGSYARGEATQNSDVDLLIIANSQLPRFKRSRVLYKNLIPYPFSMDLVVYTPEEIEKDKKSPLSFVSTVLKEGKIVYERRN